MSENMSPELGAEETARQIGARNRAMLESAPDAMLIVNDYGRILMVNTKAEKLFGYSRAEMLGYTVEMLLPERFPRPAYAVSHQLLRQPHRAFNGLRPRVPWSA